MQDICWNCKFFEHNNEQGTYSGRCRRKAPSALDVNGLVASYINNRVVVQFGVNDNVIHIAGADVSCKAGNGSDLSSDSSGYNAGSIWPVVIPKRDNITDYKILGGTLLASLANTNDVSKATIVTCRMSVFRINGDTETDIFTAEWNLSGDAVGVSGNTTNNFICVHTDFDGVLESVGGLPIGMKTKLVASDPNFVGEIRNPMVALEIVPNADINITNSFPWIANGNIDFCGDFVPAISPIPLP